MKMKNLMKKTILALGKIGVSATSFTANNRTASNPAKQVQTQQKKKSTSKTAKKTATKATTSKKNTRKTVNSTPVKKQLKDKN